MIYTLPRGLWTEELTWFWLLDRSMFRRQTCGEILPRYGLAQKRARTAITKLGGAMDPIEQPQLNADIPTYVQFWGIIEGRNLLIEEWRMHEPASHDT